MTAFEYASGLISIIIGLAIARVLGGIGAILSVAVRTRRDWIVGAWCIVLFLTLVGWWMIGWQALRPRVEFSFGILIFWTSVTALLYLAAYLLVPGAIADRAEGGETNFRLPSGAFFACLAAHFAAMFIYSIAGPGSEPSMVHGILVLLAIASVAGVGVETDRGYTIHLAVWVSILVTAAVVNIPALG